MTIAHIFNGELGFDVRTKLNDVIDIVNTPPSGGMAIGGAITGGTAGRVLFAGAGGILDDDSTFTWNDSLKDLAIGGAYYVNAARALYVVPHVTENNWFEGNSGNQTVIGYGNFATGDLALQSVTSGYDNVGVGTHALQFLTDGYNNFAFGSFALNYTVSDRNNVAIGAFALEDLGTAGIGGSNNTNNIAIGFGAINNLKQGYSNVGIGSSALANIAGTTTAYQNTIVGASAGSYLGVAAGGGAVTKNIMIGANAALNLQGVSSYNTWIGGFQGPSAVINGTVCLSTGGGEGSLVEYNIAKAGVWSFHTDPNVGYAASIHLYNTQVAIGDIGANYERAILDWRSPLNVFTIGTQAGGTGVVRPIRWTGLSSKATPIGADSLLLLDSASSGDMKTVLISTLPGGGGGMSIGGAITGGTAGRVLFAGVGGILDDDSTFTWNDTLKDLAIGGAYYVNAARALYVVPHVSGNNWFEGSAGNQTVTGYGNFGTGDLSLAAVTTGNTNVAIGTRALNALTVGGENFGMGTNALRTTVSDNYNVAIGTNAMYSLGVGGAGSGNNRANVAIGFGAFSQATQGADNIAIGFASMSNVVSPATANNNTIIGGSAANNIGTSTSGAVNSNTFIGSNSGFNVIGSSSNNVWIGGYKGPAAVVNTSITLSDGTGTLFLMDCHLVSNYIWSFNMAANTVPACLHIYNKQSPAFTTTNYERAMVGWDINGNNYFRIGSEAGGTGVNRIIIIDAFAKAGAPAAADVLAGSFAVIDDTSAGQTWLVFNKAGTIRKVQLT